MYQRLGQAQAGARLGKPRGPMQIPRALPSVIARAFLRVFTARQKDQRRLSRAELTDCDKFCARARA